MQFSLTRSSSSASTASPAKTHCGVMEFSAQEGLCYMPYWMMQNLLLKEGDIVKVANVSLKKASFVKFRPRTKDFLDISNPKAVLEKSLRTYSCMTAGDQICIPYNGKKYFIDVLEVRPDGKASIIETDVSIDFAPPADYVEPSRSSGVGGGEGASSSSSSSEAKEGGDDDDVPPPLPQAEGGGGEKSRTKRNISDLEKGKKPDETKTLTPFSGQGRRLDGKALKPSQRASGGNTADLASLAKARRERMAAAAEARRKRNERKVARSRQGEGGRSSGSSRSRRKEEAFGGSGTCLGTGE